MNLLEELSIPVLAIEEMPDGFAPITRPIPSSEEDIIRSIWFTLRCTDAVCTYDNPINPGAAKLIMFWRKPIKQKRHPRVIRKFCVYNGRGREED